MDQALNQKIDAFIAANKEQWLKDIEALVSINSVESTPAEGAPFGQGARAALDKTLELAAGMGFATRNCENYIGYAELPGADAEKYLATICHVDVVPEGNGWTGDPFQMEVRDGWLIGRGVADDKGPMITILYALKFLKEQGYSLKYPIRALVGDNEETSMADVKYYLKHYPAPVFCFTPDAEFPVCNGEKGHFGAELVSPVCNGEIKDFVGGVANNAVPDRASALVETDITKLKNAPNITLEPEGNGVRIRGWGKSGHAATPQGTVNAIGLVVDYLLDNGLCNEAERAYLEALKKLHSSTADSCRRWTAAIPPAPPATGWQSRSVRPSARALPSKTLRALSRSTSGPTPLPSRPASTPTTRSPGRTPPRSPWAAAPMPATSPMRSALARSTTTSSCLLSAARCTAPTSRLQSTSCWRP